MRASKSEQWSVSRASAHGLSGLLQAPSEPLMRSAVGSRLALHGGEGREREGKVNVAPK